MRRDKPAVICFPALIYQRDFIIMRNNGKNRAVPVTCFSLHTGCAAIYIYF